jgi:DNA topoisomerase VI subunit B
MDLQYIIISEHVMIYINLYNDAYAAEIAAKRYRTYIKEEEKNKKKRMHSKWITSIIAAIFWLLKLITSGLEKINIKKKRVIEKIIVE